MTLSLQVPWHYREVLWRDRHLGDRRRDAHQSQLAQLCVPPAEERHLHEQLSWHAHWQLSQSVGGQSLWSFASSLGESTFQRSELRRTANWEGTPGLGWKVFELLLVTKGRLFLISDCWWGSLTASLTWRQRKPKMESLRLIKDSVNCLCKMWTCKEFCFNVCEHPPCHHSVFLYQLFWYLFIGVWLSVREPLKKNHYTHFTKSKRRSLGQIISMWLFLRLPVKKRSLKVQCLFYI